MRANGSLSVNKNEKLRFLVENGFTYLTIMKKRVMDDSGIVKKLKKAARNAIDVLNEKPGSMCLLRSR